MPLTENDQHNINKYRDAAKVLLMHKDTPTSGRNKFMEQGGCSLEGHLYGWSAINRDEEFVVMGLWIDAPDLETGIVFSSDWITNERGRQNSNYRATAAHLSKILFMGYQLYVFPMAFSDEKKDSDGVGAAVIDRYYPKLMPVKLVQEATINGDIFWAVPQFYAGQNH